MELGGDGGPCIRVLEPSHLFCLDTYRHTRIFEGCRFAWEAMQRLEAYLHTQALGRIEGEVSPFAYLVNPSTIRIGKGTVVQPGAYIQGPCVIGERCEIRHGAYIRGEVLVGDGCVIGHDTEIKHAIFLDGVQAAHFNYVGDSILGNRVVLGAGVKCANLRLDEQTVRVCVDGQIVCTGLKKLGAILGDDTKLGCNSVTNPGAVVGRGVVCAPCAALGGYIAPYTKVKK